MKIILKKTKAMKLLEVVKWDFFRYPPPPYKYLKGNTQGLKDLT
jgi:hypothetical protein